MFLCLEPSFAWNVFVFLFKHCLLQMDASVKYPKVFPSHCNHHCLRACIMNPFSQKSQVLLPSYFTLHNITLDVFNFRVLSRIVHGYLFFVDDTTNIVDCQSSRSMIMICQCIFLTIFLRRISVVVTRNCQTGSHVFEASSVAWSIFVIKCGFLGFLRQVVWHEVFL